MENSHQPVAPVLPGYTMIEPLGIGGTAVVWLARQLSLDRVVAIKVLAPALVASPEARAQFQREAIAAAKLTHPNIVGILDFGDQDGHLYYVMEYVPGTSLADWLAQHQRMAPAQALKLAGIIAAALNTVYTDTHLIHRDIKPGNILIGTDGAVKITDLGLAIIVDFADGHEPADCIEGTPTYMSPEQIAGLDSDCRSDIYSLGLTLYHLLTGIAPFENRALDDVLDAQQTDYLPDPSDVLPDVPTAYGWLLSKMTAKNPAQRHTNWTEVLRDIERIKQGQSPLPPYPPDDASTILLNPRRRPSARTQDGQVVNGRKIILSGAALAGQDPRSAARAAKKAASSGPAGCLKFLIFLLVLGGALYGLYEWKLKDDPQFQAMLGRRPPPSADDAAPSTQQTAAPATDAAAQADGFVDTLEPQIAAFIDAGGGTEGSWDNPAFIAAAQTFNTALAAYQNFLKAPETYSGMLPDIIAGAREAAAQLDALRPQAPASVPMLTYANQAYQLVNDASRAAMPSDALRRAYTTAPKKRQADAAPYPTPSVAADDRFSPHYMQFGYAWEILPAPVDSQTTTDFIFLFSTIDCTPTADTRADNQVSIHGPLKWMMPIEQAVRLIGGSPAPRTPAPSDLFPAGGFFTYTYPAGRFGRVSANQPPYPVIRLIVDSEDRLVAVQLVDETPAPPLQLSAASFQPIFKTKDFITGESIPDAGTIRVHHRVLTGDRIYRIDTEAADLSADRTTGTPLYRSALYLPQTVAGNLLYHINGAR